MVSALLIDLDGVVRDWDPMVARRVEAGAELPPGCLTATAFAEPHLSAAITGRITDAQWRQVVADAVAERYGAGARGAVEAWFAFRGRVNGAVVDLVRQQRAQHPVVLFSNATSALGDDLDRLGLAEEFDAIFNSSVLGVAKPDPAAFQAVLDALGLRATDCRFVDDTGGHVAAAAAMGFHTHRFRSPAGLAGFLAMEESSPPG